jgi:hypothetical protein
MDVSKIDVDRPERERFKGVRVVILTMRDKAF